MKLLEIERSIMGGNAVPGVGTIHKTEIAPTLRRLEKTLGLLENFLDDRLLGSVGKKEYSGDIDIVMDPVPITEIQQFFKDLKILYGRDSVRISGTMVNVSVPIEQFNESYQDRGPRTGKVQVDFIFDDPVFTKLFNFSPGDDSEYKGVHRNIALSSIASLTECVESSELDNRGRPVEKIRWKWSPKGFYKVHQKSRLNENSEWLRTQKDIIISEYIKDPQFIVEKLFGPGATVSVLDSLETIIEAIKHYFDENKQQLVFKKIAHNFEEYNQRSKKTDLTEYGVPVEILPFMTKDDK